MSSRDSFLSSPPRAGSSGQNFSSSSPCLPSLDEIFLKKSHNKSPLHPRNRAAPVSHNTHTFTSAAILLRDTPKPDIDIEELTNSPPLRTKSHTASTPYNTTFTSAAIILRDAPEIDIDTEEITDSPPRREKEKSTSGKRNTSKPNISSVVRNSTEPVIAIGSLSPKDKPWQKFISEASTRDGDQPLRSQCAKRPTTRKLSGRAFESIPKHHSTGKEVFLSEDTSSGVKNKNSTEDVLDGVVSGAEQELALPRRGDWTPPRANDPIVLHSDSDTRELVSSVDKEPVSKDVFQNLHSQYGRKDVELAQKACQQPKDDFLKKRKRIELISIGQNHESLNCHQGAQSLDVQQPEEQTKRADLQTPVPKKKTRTITELAIAPFAAPLPSDIELAGPATKESMLDYFDVDGAVKALVEHQSAVMSQRKPKAKETKKPSKTRRKTKGGTEANPILLSPSTALKQSSNQDFLFGTSSQLVQEDSPTTLRDIQAAIRASNSLNSVPFDPDIPQRLWHAGARDEEGELMEMEVIDLQHGRTVKSGSDSTTTPSGRDFVDIDDILDSPLPVTSSPNTISGGKQTVSHFFRSQNTKYDSNGGAPESQDLGNATSVEPRPNYELFTDGQLSKQIASYGFKVVKKRAAMIALLDQCWTSKHQGKSAGSTQHLSTSSRTPTPAQQESTSDVQNKAPSKPQGRGRRKKDGESVTSIAKPTPSDTSSSKRPRGRPKKNETAPTTKAESSTSIPSPRRPRGRTRKPSTTSVEIPDSENETPSPISSPDPVFSSPPLLDLTTSEEGDMSLNMSPTDKQAELFKHITKAVTSTPRSQDPSSPSWYEKMLLYDPIILEELASWLNGGELTRVGYDGEVSPSDVKKWCESKSVICLWQQNTRGKERKRY
ncbi:hypothetical protein F5B22DRAFT_595150 [Xylaria bambusicola]|uniref:uncharacterized protein n=1 Tax=Xylaria bambusicola TaxID=326684 RepID=UPI0020083838|nr:uncharacterized protein F5B22DRAFT_595150 [Xylaria bambusicola]KAI0521489.1 hypothetical protein F5B22DRAFT_595150 [Xylaria bambusicola]